MVESPSPEAAGAPGRPEPPYEAPRVELVLTDEQLEREVLYGGAVNSTIS